MLFQVLVIRIVQEFHRDQAGLLVCVVILEQPLRDVFHGLLLGVESINLLFGSLILVRLLQVNDRHDLDPFVQDDPLLGSGRAQGADLSPIEGIVALYFGSAVALILIISIIIYD